MAFSFNDLPPHLRAEALRQLKAADLAKEGKPRCKRGQGKVGKKKAGGAAFLATESSLEADFGMRLAAEKHFGFEVPEREYVFHPERKWKLDFAWLRAKVAVELDGGNWGIGKPCPVCHRRQMGRHNTGKGFEDDKEKMLAAAELGWVVVGLTRKMVESGEAIKQLRTLLQNRYRELGVEK